MLQPDDPGLDGAIALVLPEGVLTGVERGEFGGELEWTSRRGGAGFVHGGINPIAMIRRGESVFVAEGLSHLAHNRGQVLRLQRQGPQRWRIERFADLGAAPRAAWREDERHWTILTAGRLLRLDLDSGRLQSLHADPDWPWLDARSLLPDGEGWLIAGQAILTRLSPTREGFAVHTYQPEGCPLPQPSAADPCR